MSVSKPSIGQLTWGQVLNDALDSIDTNVSAAQSAADAAATAASNAQTTANTANTAAATAQARADSAYTLATPDPNHKTLIRDSGTGTWPSRTSATVHTWIETQPATPKVPNGMANGDYYIGPDGMSGLAPGGTP